ncbi:MAG TPA: DNA polymerase IV [Actinomycetota bacterium]|nr:DNA polymerase IV [Actinomycetota bacterium]
MEDEPALTADWSSPILHADLDAFYASVEVLDDPSLAGKPVIVGGTSGRGVVTSASYEARRYGVHSAMPMTRARRLCPNGVFLAPKFPAYIARSRQVKAVFDSFSVAVEPLALDEAFLDLRRAHRLWPDPATAAEALKDRVFRSTGLVVSIGVAPNKFLAKIASKLAKPDGVLVVEPAEVESFLAPLPVDALWGVGEQTAVVLRRMGLATIADVASCPLSVLERALGSHGAGLAQLAAGRDSREVVPDQAAKSVGAEETFPADLTEATQMLAALLKLSDRVASRLRAQGISGSTVSLKIRLSSFETFGRSRTLKREVDAATGIYGVARELLESFLADKPPSRRSIRLLGVSVGYLSQWPATDRLDLDRQPEWGAAELALDRIRRRFGEGAVGFGALLEES